MFWKWPISIIGKMLNIGQADNRSTPTKNEHDETAPAAFCFLYSTSTKNFIIVIIKNMQLISYQSKTGLVMGRGPALYDWKYFIFNVFVYVQYLVLTCCSLK